VVGTVLLVVHRGSRPFAFGPAMAVGALVTLLAIGPP
jgi:prepilin signal peptidase PulO-like enzyme (type II secretory pathway)